MKRTSIETGGFNPVSVSQSYKRMRSNPEFKKAYDALEDEFQLLHAVAEARARSRQSQDAIALKMKTSQAAVARLESGRGNPSVRTLKRYAAATGTKLRIAFEPQKKKPRSQGRPTAR
jgi:ribosome-binding protein aMBF1 (putative translation factor)